MNEAIISNKKSLLFKALPEPTLQARSVIIDQQFFGMNYDDIKVIDGTINNPNKHGILGIEAAGIVKFASRDCTKGFKVGDRVCYATFHPGAFIKERCVHENYLLPLPNYASLEMGATLLKGLMSYTLLGKIFIIEPQSVILLSGASGAIGSFVTQIASRAKLKVIALTRSNEKINYIKSNGASLVINYKTEDAVQKIQEFTKGKGVDYFFDCLGKDMEDIALKALKVRGFYIQFGSITGEADGINLVSQKYKSLTVTRASIGNFISDYNNFVTTSFAFFKSIQAGALRPQIQSYDFKNAALAFEEIKKGSIFGQKVLSLK